MSKHLHRDLELLTRQILTMGSLVEDALRDALESLRTRSADLAHSVIRGDDGIDQKELEVEDECLKILALHQPVAADLRFIVAVLKVNNDLERMADMAKNIAKRVRALARTGRWEPPAGMELLAERVLSMVSRSLDALVRADPEIARGVCRDDEAVDKIHKNISSALQQTMEKDGARIPEAVGMLAVSRFLERVADLATNIAEDVVFTVEGELIRHGGIEEAQRSSPPLRVLSEPRT
jgi:phosphate transport system protein